MAKITTDSYDALAAHLDRSPIGAPPAPELRPIIEALFTPEQAALAAKAPFRPTAAAELARAAGMDLAQAAPLLEAMADRGVMYQRQGQDGDYYSLLPLLPGMAELQFMGGEVSEEKRELAWLFEDYYRPGFGPALVRAGHAGTPYSRVIPVGRTVEGRQEILPYEQAEQVLRDARAIAVTTCYCRHESELRGQGCGAPKDVCLMFGAFAKYVAKKGKARLIELDEALKILERAEEAGLVHVTDNVASGANFMCNCCGCCCMFLRTITELNQLGGVAQAGFVAEVDPAECSECGACLDACQVGAIRMDDAPAVVDYDRCLGCGQCKTVCSFDAVNMRRRTTTAPAADFVSLGRAIAAGRADAA